MTIKANPPTATIQSAIQARDLIGSLDQHHISHIMLVAEKDSEVTFSHLTATEAAKPLLNSVVERSSRSFANCEIIDYDPAATIAPGQLMWIDTDKVPGLTAIIPQSDGVAGILQYDPKKTKLSEVRFVSMSVSVGNARAYFIEHLADRQVIAKTKTFGVLIKKGSLDAPKQNQLALIGEDVSVIVVNNIVLFRNRRAFQYMFGFLEELRLKAETTFNSITAKLRIDGLEDLRIAASGSPQMLGKMASIQKKMDEFTEYKDAMTMPRLIKFIQTHPQCGVEVTGAGRNAKIVYKKDAQHRFKILNLLDDDNLHSELTSLEYTANSKGAPIPATT